MGVLNQISVLNNCPKFAKNCLLNANGELRQDSQSAHLIPVRA